MEITQWINGIGIDLNSLAAKQADKPDDAIVFSCDTCFKCSSHY